MALFDYKIGFSFLILLLLLKIATGQIQTDFNQKPWPQDTTWTGDTSKFKINNKQQLQLIAPSQTSTAHLVTPKNPTNPPIEWEIWVRMDFSPSRSNKLKIYLSSDTSNLKAKPIGYFLKIGENGSDDGIDLYRQDGGSQKTLIKSKDGIAAKNDNRFRIKVKRDTSGTWTLNLDTLGGNRFYQTGKATDTTYPVKPYFGIFCDYTSTRADRFYFDDLYAGKPKVDSTPPQVESVTPITKDSLLVEFSEGLNVEKAQNRNFYQVNKGIGKPETIVPLTRSWKKVALTFDTNLNNKTHYKLLVDSATDFEGNTRMATDTTQFDFFEANPGDIIINELLPDPSPTQGLPESEFLELHNKANYRANLADWKIADLTSSSKIPNKALPPDSFAILCDEADSAKFSAYGLVIPLSRLPSLNNGGDHITLLNPDSLTIDQVNYEPDWFDSSNKKSGGYSLERINPLHPCGGKSNWRGSQNPQGGTPGSQNSIDSSWQDTTPPSIIHVEVEDSLTLNLKFNETLDTNNIQNNFFNIKTGPDILSLSILNTENLQIELQDPLTPNDTNQIEYHGIQDCWGNAIQKSRVQNFQFLNPGNAGFRDVVINELMHNPRPPENLPPFEYIEILNRSDKIVSTKNWEIADPVNEAKIPDSFLYPGEYAILVSQSHKAQFTSLSQVVAVSGLPTMNIGGDFLRLKNNEGILIDSVTYDRSWFDSEEKREGGWALEQINPDHPCPAKANWEPSVNSNGGTPGQINSVDSNFRDTIPPYVTQVFVNDETTIKLEFDESIDTIGLSISQFSISNGTRIRQLSIPNDKSLILNLEDPLSSNDTHQLKYHGIKDCWGNKLQNTKTIKFPFIKPDTAAYRDVVINEIMANPKPPKELPPAQFIELHNASNKIISLKDWELADPVRGVLLPDTLLFPGDYVIIIEKDYREPFSAYGKSVPVSRLPTFNIGGDYVSLKNGEGTLIDSLTYDRDWFESEEKREGGWALEQINPHNPCPNKNNWKASENQQGGTPGNPNSVMNEQPDTVAPWLTNAKAKDTNVIQLRFSERVDSLSLLNAEWELKPEHAIEKIEPNARLTKKAQLHLSENLLANTTYTIIYEGLADCWGNESGKDTLRFEYLVPKEAAQNDLVIHEIMANPEPPVELPPYQYLELKNISDKILSLEDCALEDNTGQTPLPKRLIKPDSLLILCDQEAEEVFNAYGNTLGIASFPRLNVTGERLTLSNAKGQAVFSINYQRSWFNDDLKAEGGWSLEMVDTEDPCGEKRNWAASENKAGGTPGMANSVQQYQPDVHPPELSRVAMKDSSTLILYLNEKLDSLATLAKTSFTVQPEAPPIQSILPQPPDFSTIHLHFQNPLDANEIYTLKVDSLVDCAGNVQTETQEARFGPTQKADSFSLVINEILFNPKPNGADYVELYNPSNQVIDLQNLYWASLDDAYQLENPVPLTGAPLQLLPDQYMAFTDDAAHVRNNYHIKNPDQLFELESLPTWPNEAGNVLLVNEKGQKIDRVDYSADWHMDMLNNEEGVSLERIAFEGPSNKAANWHSAAADAGFGTPTYENSQHGEIKAQEKPVKIDPKAFSPNQDGYRDFVSIRYDLKKPGFMANVEVYDVKGREVTTLVHNQSVGKSGKWKWDGSKAGGGKAAIGSYILFIELFHPEDGDTQTYKEAVTLSP